MTITLGLSGEEVLKKIPSEGVYVLDLGGGANPIPRADFVVDLLSYSQRLQKPFERFDEGRWIVRDLCSREPLPFSDKYIDFVFAAEVLEDIRDPIWVCSEMVRVAKRGYISMPHRDTESSFKIDGRPENNRYPGFCHHRWLVEVQNNVLVFTHKHSLLHLLEFERHDIRMRHLTLYWEDSFEYRENILLSYDDMVKDLQRYEEWRRAQPLQWFYGRPGFALPTNWTGSLD